MNPSDASTTISNGVRPRGVAWPRDSVSQTTPFPNTCTSDTAPAVAASPFRTSNGFPPRGWDFARFADLDRAMAVLLGKTRLDDRVAHGGFARSTKSMAQARPDVTHPL